VSRPLRVGLARVAQESNAFSPLPSELADFQRTHWLVGEALGAVLGPEAEEAPGFLRDAELSGAARALADDPDLVIVPIFSAWAVPGGPLSAEALTGLRDALLAALEAAGPLDGLVLSLHGAMGAAGTRDPEAWLLAQIRERLGPELPIVCTVDLHAHLSPAKMRQTPYWIAYRTNPHRDHAEVGARAARLLRSLLRGEARPVVAWRSLPMVMGGGTTLDFAPTMRPIFQRFRRWEREGRVLAASLLMCHVWNDDPELGWAVHVVTDGNGEAAERLADELAEAAWAVRVVEPPRWPTAEEAISQARRARWRRKLGAVCVSDASDMVGAGAPGESTLLLRALLERASDLRCYAPVRDAEAVEALWGVAEGAQVSLSVGGRFDPVLHPPLPVSGRVGLRREIPGLGRAVALDCGHLQLVITEGPPLAMKPAFYRDMGLPPWRADLVVVKSLFPFRLYFALHNRLTLYARTAGATDLDAPRRLRFAGPVHPLQELPDWRAEDRRRRLV
jgi:microcystin degradation protein MlrC